MATDLKQHNGITLICFQTLFSLWVLQNESEKICLCDVHVFQKNLLSNSVQVFVKMILANFQNVFPDRRQLAIKRALRSHFTSEKLEMLNEKTKRNIDTISLWWKFSVWSGSQKLVGADLARCDFFHKTCLCLLNLVPQSNYYLRLSSRQNTFVIVRQVSYSCKNGEI